MTNRRDFLKAGAAAGSGLFTPLTGRAVENRASGHVRIDFQTFLPAFFDEKPFHAADLIALEDESEVGGFMVFPETTLRPDNRGLAERIRSFPRMIGCASVNPTLGAEAVWELERSVRDFGFKGVRLSPAAHAYPIDGKIVDPVLEKARDMRVPVTVDGDEEHCRILMIAAAAERFPEVTFIVDMGYRPRAYPPSMPASGELRETAKRCANLHFGVTALTASESHYVKSIAAAAGAGRMVFGSSAPYGIPLFAVRGIIRAAMGKEAEALIFGENLKRLYRLV